MRRELTFLVVEGFPKIVEKDLPVGIGNVSYELSLAACQPYAVTTDSMIASLTSEIPGI